MATPDKGSDTIDVILRRKPEIVQCEMDQILWSKHHGQCFSTLSYCEKKHISDQETCFSSDLI